MRQQLGTEWSHFLHAWSVRVVSLLFLSGAVIMAADSDMNGYRAPFTGFEYWGFMGPVLYAVIVAAQVAGEYQNGRAAQAAAETKKGQYFAAKVMGLFSLSALLCLTYTAVSVLICCMKNGMGSGHFSHYPLQVAVFLFCKVLSYWVYIAVFLLIGVLIRRRVWAFLLSCGAVFLETFLWLIPLINGRQPAIGGPMTAWMLQPEKYLGMANFLSYDFYLLFVPGVYIGVIALVIAYHVFRRGKLQTGSRRRPIRFFTRITQGLIMIAVLFLFWGQTTAWAEEGTASLADLQSMENVGELRLVFGDASLADEDAFVLLLMAEGFTDHQQEDFFRGAEDLASALMNTSPYDEFADVTKIYAIGTISAESGVKGDKAATRKEALQDFRDTFWGVSYWEEGSKWRLEIPHDGARKMYYVRRQFLPGADFCGIIINSDMHRGVAYYGYPAGNIFLSTLAPEVLPHELGHVIAQLADEYNTKGYYFTPHEAPNMTRESDPGKVPWAEYIGIDDISVYGFSYERTGWYHPSNTCIMQRSGTGRFCRVCEDALRQSICTYCKTTRLLFKSYGEQVPESKRGTDLRDCFSVQYMSNHLAGSQIPEEFLSLRYYDKNGGAVEGLPGKAGKYSVEAEFLGYQTGDVVYEPCTLRVSYVIRPDPAKVFWLSVTPLFIGAVLWIAWLKLRSKR